MLLKIIAFISAAIPLILFARAVLGRRPSRLGTLLGEFKKQVDIAITIFLGIIGCVVAYALGKLAWGWWMAV